RSRTACATGYSPSPCRNNVGLDERSKGKQLCPAECRIRYSRTQLRIAFHILLFRRHMLGRRSYIAVHLPLLPRLKTKPDQRLNECSAQISVSLALAARSSHKSCKSSG